MAKDTPDGPPGDADAPENDPALTAVKYFEGVGDTVIQGANKVRVELGGFLALVNEQLAGRTPDLEVIGLKKVLEETLAEFQDFEHIQNPEVQRAVGQQADDVLEMSRLTFRVLDHEKKKREKGLSSAPREIDPANSTLVVPPDWDDPERPLH